MDDGDGGETPRRGSTLPEIRAQPSHTGAPSPAPPRGSPNEMLERARRQLRDGQPRLAQYEGGKPWKAAAGRAGRSARPQPTPAEIKLSIDEQLKPVTDGRTELSKRDVARLVVDSARLAETSTKLKVACTRALRIAGDVERLRVDDDPVSRAQQRYEAVRTEGCRVVVLQDKDDEDMYEQLLAAQRQLACAVKAVDTTKLDMATPVDEKLPHRPGQIKAARPAEGRKGHAEGDEYDDDVDPEVAELMADPPPVEVDFDEMTSNAITHRTGQLLHDCLEEFKEAAPAVASLRNGLGDFGTDNHRLTNAGRVHSCRLAALRVEHTQKRLANWLAAVKEAVGALAQKSKTEAALAAKEITELRREVAQADEALRERERQLEDLLNESAFAAGRGGRHGARGGGGKKAAAAAAATSPSAPSSPMRATADAAAGFGSSRGNNSLRPPRSQRRPPPLLAEVVGADDRPTPARAIGEPETPHTPVFTSDPGRTGKMMFASNRALLVRMQRNYLYTMNAAGLQLVSPHQVPAVEDEAAPAPEPAQGKKKGKRARAATKKGGAGAKEKTELETLLQYQRTLLLQEAQAADVAHVRHFASMLAALFHGRQQREGYPREVLRDEVTLEQGVLCCAGLQRTLLGVHGVALALRREVDKVAVIGEGGHPQRMDTVTFARAVGGVVHDMDTLAGTTAVRRGGYTEVLDLIHDREALKLHVAHYRALSPRQVVAYLQGSAPHPADDVAVALDVVFRWMDGGDALASYDAAAVSWPAVKQVLRVRAEQLLVFIVAATPGAVPPPLAARLVALRGLFEKTPEPPVAVELATPFARLPHYLRAFIACLERRGRAEYEAGGVGVLQPLGHIAARAVTVGVEDLSAADVVVSAVGHLASAVVAMAEGWNALHHKITSRKRYFSPAPQQRGLI